ncbi:hypothetical protein ACIQMR_35385 [Streptomyces sp. NPDC091376]|uniref:hypothetical protein n=1 Tax=Streptomyces sp. NPDC091376 TaxID=3365994 RepID=UPI00380A1562
MRSYFRPRKEHKICLYLTPDEAADFLESLDCLPHEAHPTLVKAKRMLNRAFDEFEETQ